MLIQQVVSGVANGLVYALVALGFSAIFSTARLINFAQGNMVMAGAYIALIFEQVFHLPPILLFFLTLVTTYLLGHILYATVLTRIISFGTGLRAVTSTIGIALLLHGAAIAAFGTEERRFPPLYREQPFVLGNVTIPSHSVFIAIGAICTLIFLSLFIGKTNLGRCMRAAGQDAVGAAYMGINLRRVNAVSYGLSAALGGIAGVLICPAWYVSPEIGAAIGLKGFAAAILGSMGHFTGALVGGLVLGLTENLVAGYISSEWKDTFVYLVLFVALSTKPEGVFTKHSAVRY